MKKSVTNVLITLICVVVVPNISLAQNPWNLDEWAKENIEYYLDAPRSEFVGLEFDQQRALYELFSPQQKADVWKYKWRDIRKSDLLSTAEKKELKKLYSLVSPRVFDENDTESYAKFQVESDRLKSTLVKDFGWDDKKLFAYLMCGMTEAEIRMYCQKYNLQESDYL